MSLFHPTFSSTWQRLLQEIVTNVLLLTSRPLLVQVIYDQLVKPHNAITNYHTDKSGITEALLRDVDVTLPDVQAKFLELVPAEAILVGHALENDLKALKVVHMRCIDTGALFPHPRVSPTMLHWQTLKLALLQS